MLLTAAMLARHGQASADIGVNGVSPSIAVNSPSEHLFDQVLASLAVTSNEPVVFSPLCLADALNLLLAGAAAETAKGLSGISASLVNYAVRDGIPAGNDTASALRRVTALWLASGIQAGTEAVQTKPLPESPDEAVRQINAWASENTNGLVPSILDQLPPRSPMVVTSALHFADKWRTAFDLEDTSEAPFRLASGQAVQVPFLHGTPVCRYMRHGSLHAVIIPYADDDFKLLAIAPAADSNPNEVLTLCRRGGLGAVLKHLKFDRSSLDPMEIVMPRFNFSFMSDLRPALMKTALAPIFAPGANLNRLTSTPVQPSAVLQRVVIRVDEKGTEAAAATVVTTERNLKMLPRFVADTPFLAVVLSKTASPVVVALVTDPSRSAT
jgi:serpin B